MKSPVALSDLRRQVLTGIAFMCLAAAILPFLNTAAKQLTADYAILQIVWARYAGQLLYMIAVFAPSRGLGLFATRRPGIHLLRSGLLLVSTVLYFTALRYISLPMAAAINFTSPLIVTLLAIPMLGETVGWRRFAAVGVGFAGALIIIRPGVADTHWSAILVLGTACAYALYQILTRRVAALDTPETSVTYTAVVGTIATTLALPMVWRLPTSGLDWGLFASLGLVAGTGHFFVVKAYQHGPASVISPFSYVQLIGAAVLGYAFFGDVPDAWTWAGAGMIVASGVYVIYREGVRRRLSRRSGTAR